MAESLCRAFGDRCRPRVTGAYRLGDVRHVFAATDRAASVLGFRAAVPFEEGIREFAAAPLRVPADRSPAPCPQAVSR
jgi:dTDP-L-rhamnose 4-epimerase